MIPYALLLLAYLLGSLPVGVLIARLFRAGDPRAGGSGNIGATNVLRTAGLRPALLTLLLDALKGAVPVLLGRALLGESLWLPAFGLAAIVGHIAPVFLLFRGGKGVATAFGALLALHPPTAGLAALTWVAAFALTRYASAGSVAAAITLPPCAWFLTRQVPFFGFALGASLLLLVRHRDNILRLSQGRENRVSFRNKT